MDQRKVFKYKLDFYYQQALVYLLTMIVYGGVRGNLGEGKFVYILLGDPIMYIIVFFVVMSFVSLALNFLRNRRLIIDGDALVFSNRFHERRIEAKEIEWMHIGRELRVQTAGKFQVVVFKLFNRRRVFRIRVGRYERTNELVDEIKRIATHLPRPKRRRWMRMRREK